MRRRNPLARCRRQAETATPCCPKEVRQNPLQHGARLRWCCQAVPRPTPNHRHHTTAAIRRTIPKQRSIPHDRRRCETADPVHHRSGPCRIPNE